MCIGPAAGRPVHRVRRSGGEGGRKKGRRLVTYYCLYTTAYIHYTADIHIHYTAYIYTVLLVCTSHTISVIPNDA